jgi:glycosyl transferase family 2
MARIRCITMQKDEGLLLDAWLRYYGYLFGFENLEVLDNGSSDKLTRSILEQFEAVGVTVHRQYTGIEHFEGKGAIVAGIIEGWDRTHDYDFALPCDTDEFLALFTAKGLSCGRNQVETAMDGLLGSEQALWIPTSLLNVPSQSGWFHPEHFPKGFLPSRSILSLDSGYHIPQTRLQEGTRRTDFTYLHYHNKPYEVVQAHTRRKLYRRVDLNDPAALRTYDGAGAHMTKDLLMSRDEYLHQFDHEVTVQFGFFPTLMRVLGARDPMVIGEARLSPGASPELATLRLPATADGPAELVPFDGPGYLSDNPDVAVSGKSGLPHYLYYGFAEGRTLRRPEKPATALSA